MFTQTREDTKNKNNQAENETDCDRAVTQPGRKGNSTYKTKLHVCVSQTS